jgi:hypothetical protein
LPMAPPMTRPMPQPVMGRSVRRSHTNSPMQTPPGRKNPGRQGAVAAQAETHAGFHDDQAEKAVDHRHRRAGFQQEPSSSSLESWGRPARSRDCGPSPGIEASHREDLTPSPPFAAPAEQRMRPTCRPLPVPASSAHFSPGRAGMTAPGTSGSVKARRSRLHFQVRLR